MLFHLKVYDDPVLLKAQKKEAEMRRKEAIARFSPNIMNVLIIITTVMTTIREEKRRVAKHKREREGRLRGWNLIREKYNIKRKEEKGEYSDYEGGSGKVEEEEEEVGEGIITEAKIQAVERIEDATSLVTDLLRF